MNPERFHPEFGMRADEVVIKSAQNRLRRARQEGIDAVHATAQAAVNQVKATRGGLIPGKRPHSWDSTGVVIIKRDKTPNGADYATVGIVDVHNRVDDGHLIDEHPAVEDANVRFGFALSEIPFDYESGRDISPGSIETGLDGQSYYVEWDKHEGTADTAIRRLVDPALASIDGASLDEGQEALASIDESIGYILAAATNPELNPMPQAKGQ